MEPKEKNNLNYLNSLGISAVFSWSGLALIGTVLYVGGAHEWSLIPVFAGVWVLWRRTSSTGLAVFLGIGLAVQLTRIGFSLERGTLYGDGWGADQSSVILAQGDSDIFLTVFFALGIILGYWLFCIGTHMNSLEATGGAQFVDKSLFCSSGKWVYWFWVLILVGAVSLGIYEILLKQPEIFLSELGWRGPLRLGRFLILAWLLGGAVVLIQLWGLKGAFNARSKSKSLLYLQETLWRETRREQSRSEQWIVHAIQYMRKMR